MTRSMACKTNSRRMQRAIIATANRLNIINPHSAKIDLAGSRGPMLGNVEALQRLFLGFSGRRYGAFGSASNRIANAASRVGAQLEARNGSHSHADATRMVADYRALVDRAAEALREIDPFWSDAVAVVCGGSRTAAQLVG